MAIAYSKRARVVKIHKSRLVVLPKPMTDILGIKENDEVLVTCDGEAIHITKG